MKRVPQRLALVLLAWALSSLTFAQQLGTDNARFFLTRTGFAPSPVQIAAFASLTRQQAVDQVLTQASTTTVVPAPDWVSQPPISPRSLKGMSEDERKAWRAQEIRQGFELRGWWLRQMLSTSSPLAERMTLFWHNHFVSSQQKVRYSLLMYRQNALLRQHALGNFGKLLHAVSKDPAMVIYLDNANNRKGIPNENFAREVMELFTLGEGHYGEQDVKEAARAFTGWSIDPDSGDFKWRARMHDDGIKTVLGKSGNFDGDDVLDILLAQPACAELIVAKLWREFVSPEPDAREVARIAQRFRASGYEIRTALRELFLSPAFWDKKNRGTLVKSPVELVVGALNQFEFTYDDPLPFTFAVAQLGQNLFNPPNVKGWPGGNDWINSSTLLARKSALERLIRATGNGEQNAMRKRVAMMRVAQEEMGGAGKVKGQGALGREGKMRLAVATAMIAFDPDRWLKQFGTRADAVPDASQRQAIRSMVLPLEPVEPVGIDLPGSAYVRALVMDPVYQLK